MPDLKVPEINLVIIAGNLTGDPVYSETQSGMPVVNFHVASNKRFRDKNGSLKEDACFIGVVAWNTLATSCRERLCKGSTVVITGELQSKKVPSGAGFHNSIEIKAKKIQFLDIHRESEDPEYQDTLNDFEN